MLKDARDDTTSQAMARAAATWADGKRRLADLRRDHDRQAKQKFKIAYQQTRPRDRRAWP